MKKKVPAFLYSLILEKYPFARRWLTIPLTDGQDTAGVPAIGSPADHQSDNNHTLTEKSREQAIRELWDMIEAVQERQYPAQLSEDEVRQFTALADELADYLRKPVDENATDS